MKTSLRKLVAMICVLAIAAVLPVMASAEGTTLALTAPENAEAGDTIAVTLSIADNEGWDLLDATMVADEGLTATKYVNEWDEEYDFEAGAALGAAMCSANLKTDPMIVAAIAENPIKRNGDLMTFYFVVGDDVADGTELEVALTVKSLSESIIENNAPAGKHDRVAADTVLTATVMIGEVAPVTTTTTKGDATTTTTKGDATTTTTKGDDTTTKGDVDVTTTEADDVTTTAADDVDVTTTVAAGGDDVDTGETAPLFALALVLMAGSAVVLVTMKKKALSK